MNHIEDNQHRSCHHIDHKDNRPEHSHLVARAPMAEFDGLQRGGSECCYRLSSLESHTHEGPQLRIDLEILELRCQMRCRCRFVAVLDPDLDLELDLDFDRIHSTKHTRDHNTADKHLVDSWSEPLAPDRVVGLRRARSAAADVVAAG